MQTITNFSHISFFQKTNKQNVLEEFYDLFITAEMKRSTIALFNM